MAQIQIDTEVLRVAMAVFSGRLNENTISPSELETLGIYYPINSPSNNWLRLRAEEIVLSAYVQLGNAVNQMGESFLEMKAISDSVLVDIELLKDTLELPELELPELEEILEGEVIELPPFDQFTDDDPDSDESETIENV